MYNISADFKTAQKGNTKQITAYLDDGVDRINHDDDLKSIKISGSGSLLKSIMRQAEVKYLGSHSYLEKYVHLGTGVVLPSTAVEEIDYGQFYVTEEKLNEGSDETTLKLFDRMYEANQKWDLDDITFPITLHELMNEIATRLGWTIQAGGTYYVSSLSSVYSYTGTQHDIDHDDANIIIFNEQTGQNPAIDVTFTFNDLIGTYHWFEVKGHYVGNPAHNLKVKEWNYTTSSWVDTTANANDFPSNATEQDYSFALHTEADYISGGQRKVRIVHASNGVGTHKFYMNQVVMHTEQSFPNETRQISTNIFQGLGLTFRQILDMVAEASGSIIFFGEDDELKIKQIDSTVLETVTKTDMRSMELQTKWGECNSVVLSRMPQEDNIVQKDDDSITANGLTEIKIVNNLIVDSDREGWIGDIFDSLFGIEFHPFKVVTFGLGYFEYGDRIKVRDLSDVDYEVLVLDITLEIGQGFKETLLAKIPDKTSTAYQYAGIIGQKINNTQIIVNKQQQEIDLINEALSTVAIIPRQPEPPADPSLYDMWIDTDTNVVYLWDGAEWTPTAIDPATLENYYTKEETSAEIALTTSSITSSVEQVNQIAQTALAGVDANSEDLVTVQSQITQLQQTADALQIQIETAGGVNLLKNSVGLKGDIKDWQIFDENGDLVSADNDGTIVQTTDVQENTESHSGIQLLDQFITQTFPTIVGNIYTIYFRYLKNEFPASVTITGVASAIPISDNADWGVFKYQFTATESSTTLKIENITDGDIIISDAVVKLGDCNGWTQAPNEVYGTNYRFDKDGFLITSSTNKFKALLDNTKLAIYDTSSGSDKTVMLVSKDSGKITKLTVQDEFVIQRYENSASSTRIIPTSTGSMLVVND